MVRYLAVGLICIFCSVSVGGGEGRGRTGAVGLRPGLVWVHFHQHDFKRPSEMGICAQIDRDTGTAHHDYAMIWMGALRAPTTGEITLSAEADNGLQLMVDGEAVIDGWGNHGAREGTVEVEQGEWLPLVVKYFQLGGQGHCRVYWSWGGHERELIVPSAFGHDEDDLQRARKMLEGELNVKTPKIYDASSLELGPGAIYTPSGPTPWPAPGGGKPVTLGAGPHLFIDDYLIGEQSGLKRTVNEPQRLPEPVVTGPEDKCFQPWFTVVRDSQTGRFRIWYGVPEHASKSHIGYMESEDGIHWERPHRVLDDPAPIQFGVSVIDEGAEFPKGDQRYKLGWWEDGGLQVAVSANGIEWEPLVPGVVLPASHDIVHIAWDPIRRQYMGLVSMYIEGPAWSGHRRTPFMSVSDDLVQWEKPWATVTANDSIDEGETQFYGLGDVIARGELLVGMLKVLRDDLPADPDGPVAGIGYTVLAWSRDGRHWQRDLEPFMARNPQPGTWDHAMTWGESQLVVGDETYIYYGGYKRGHKIARFTERQIGLARMPRDRYVSRDADSDGGFLRTPLVKLNADEMTVNADMGGELRVRIVDESGDPIDGFDWDDCSAITGDATEHAVQWNEQPGAIADRPVMVEFRLRDGRLYGFGLSENR